MSDRIRTVEAKPCVFRGVHMRSKLEAKWAVVFEALRIKWEYETTLYTLKSTRLFPNGVKYLPDFHLPNWIIEVKPTPPTPEELDKAVGVLLSQDKPFAFLIDSPIKRRQVLILRIEKGLGMQRNNIVTESYTLQTFLGLNPRESQRLMRIVKSIEFTKRDFTKGKGRK